MELTTYCQCACANCGHVIEYRDSRAGEIVECPKCGEKSVLPEPEKLGMIEIFGPPIPQFRNCPVCGTQVDFMARSCETCDAAKKRKRFRLMIEVTALVIVLGIAGAMVQRYLKRSRARLAAEDLKAVTNSPKPTGPVIIMEQPRLRTPKSTNDLHVGKFVLEKKRGSDLVLAVGDIQNISENTHTQLRADFDILDKTGAKIGSVSDYFTELGPHQTWHFVATVTESNAMNLRFAELHEEK